MNLSQTPNEFKWAALVVFGAIALMALAGSTFGWGNAAVYAGQRTAYLEELQKGGNDLQDLQQKNWVCTNQEKETLLERLKALNKASVGAIVCATEPPGQETLEQMEARGKQELQCRAEWLQTVQEKIKNLDNCKSVCEDDSDCSLDEMCIEGECKEIPPCSADKDCVDLFGEGYFCSQGICFIESECANDSDCVKKYEAGYVCINGECWKKQAEKTVNVQNRKIIRERFEKDKIAPEEPQVPEMDEETKEKIKSWLGLDVDSFPKDMGKGKKGYIILSETISPNKTEILYVYKKIQYATAFMNNLGYNVRLIHRAPVPADDDWSNHAAFKAIADPGAGGVFYFSHAEDPSVEDIGADSIPTFLANARKNWYMEQGMSEPQARQKANNESSIGLDFYYNHQCHGADKGFENFADAIIREGGIYYGEPGLLWATSPPSTEYIKPYN